MRNERSPSWGGREPWRLSKLAVRINVVMWMPPLTMLDGSQ